MTGRVLITVRALTAVSAVALLVPAAMAPAAPQKVIRVNWVERVPLRGGDIALRVMRIEVQPRRWAITAEIANRSDTRVRISRRQPRNFRECTMSIVRYVRIKHVYGSTFDRRNYLPLTFRPALPSEVVPGGRWRGTFGGRGVLPKGAALYICFGFFTTAEDRDGFSVVTKRSFRA